MNLKTKNSAESDNKRLASFISFKCSKTVAKKKTKILLPVYGGTISIGSKVSKPVIIPKSAFLFRDQQRALQFLELNTDGATVHDGIE